MSIYRQRRIELFASLLEPLEASPIRILDVGGEIDFWRGSDFWNNPSYAITVINIQDEKDVNPSDANNIQWKYGNALDFVEELENGYDVLFSNSVIEHVGGDTEMEKMARQFEDFDGAYFLQTPNLWFPIEPHFRFPFFGILPFAVRVLLMRCFSLGSYYRAESWEAARGKVNTTRLLTVSQMRRLFPSATILREKWYGMTKSIYVYRPGPKTTS